MMEVLAVAVRGVMEVLAGAVRGMMEVLAVARCCGEVHACSSIIPRAKTASKERATTTYPLASPNLSACAVCTFNATISH